MAFRNMMAYCRGGAGRETYQHTMRVLLHSHFTTTCLVEVGSVWLKVVYTPQQARQGRVLKKLIEILHYILLVAIPLLNTRAPYIPNY